jgi:hypothetical protein
MTVTADGSAEAGASETTTKLTLQFDKEIVGLAREDITLSSETVKKGAVSPTLTPGEYTLDVSGINAAGTIYVSVSKSGYNISDSPQSVTVHVGKSGLQSVTAYDGGSNATTTQLTLTFDKSVTGLTKENISVTEGTGKAEKNAGNLWGGGATWYLPVTVTMGGTVSVSVTGRPSGYVISGDAQTVLVRYAAPGAGQSAVPATNAAPGTSEEG